MKKIICILFILVLNISVFAVDIKQLVIGKWAVTEMTGNKSFNFEVVFDETTYIEMSGKEMRSYPYSINKDSLCIQDECAKITIVSNDEFYVPKQNMKFVRINKN